MTDKENQKVEVEDEKVKNNELSNEESYAKRMKEKVRMATYELYKGEKRLAKELFRLWNRSNIPSKKKREKKIMQRRHIVINDENTSVITTTTATKTSSRKGKEKRKKDWDYPLIMIHYLIEGLEDYIEHINEIAKPIPKNDDHWILYLNVGIEALQYINESLKKLMSDKMSRLKKVEREKYIKVHEIMSKLEEMNTFLDGCKNIEIVTKRDVTGIELWVCALHMARCRIDLDHLKRDVKLLMHQFVDGTFNN